MNLKNLSEFGLHFFTRGKSLFPFLTLKTLDDPQGDHLPWKYQEARTRLFLVPGTKIASRTKLAAELKLVLFHIKFGIIF